MLPGSRNRSALEEQRRLAAKRSCLELRSRIIQATRDFFTQRQYLEIETPLLIPAPAPELHIDAIPAGDVFLHTSPELCMKRLLSAGYPRIFQIVKCFRQGERGQRHLPEFTMLEWYRTGFDYLDLMVECEELLLYLSQRLGLGKQILYQGREVELEPPWERLSVKEAFERYACVSLEEAMSSGRFDEVMVMEIEPHLGTPKPHFLHDYPASLAALSRLKCTDPGIAERFELYLGGGMELANAFSELTDAREQEGRFEKEKEKRNELGKTAYPVPEKFLRALPFMPASAGIALGIDRLIMLFADTVNIEDVVAFTPEEL